MAKKKITVNLTTDIELNQKEIQKQIDEITKGMTVAIPVQLDTSEGKHEYSFKGKNATALSAVLPGKFYSATQIAALLTGTDEKASKRKILELQTQRDQLQEQMRTAALEEQKILREQIKSLEREVREASTFKINQARAASRGTAFHKIVELLEKGEISRKDLTVEGLTQLAKNPKYSEDLTGLWTMGPKGKTSNISSIINQVKKYGEFKTQMGLNGQPTTEQSLGMLMKVGDKLVKVVGTLDAFFHEQGVLADFKTSSTIDPKKVPIQLNLLNQLLKANGVTQGASSMNIIHTPLNNFGKKSGVSTVKFYSEEEVYDLISKAVEIDEGVRPLSSIKLKGGLEGRLEHVKLKNGHTGTFLNDIFLGEKTGLGTMSIEDILSQVFTLSGDKLEEFINSLWSTRDYTIDPNGIETNNLYRKGIIWDELRKRVPSFYSNLFTNQIDNSVEEKDFIDEGGNVQTGTVLGGGYLSQWSKAYRLALSSGQQELSEQIKKRFINIIDNITDEGEIHRILSNTSMLTDRDTIHQVFVDAIESSLPQRLKDIRDQDYSDIGINDRSKEENALIAKKNAEKRRERLTEQSGDTVRRLNQIADIDFTSMSDGEIVGFIKGLSGIAGEFRGLYKEIGTTEMSSVDENGIPEKMDDSLYLLDQWTLFVNKLKEKINKLGRTPIETRSMMEALESISTLTEDIRQLTVKTAHRASWLYEGKNIYDQMLAPELEDINSRLPADKQLTIEEFAKHRLTPEQYEQYLSSIDFRSLFSGGRGVTEALQEFMNTPVYKLKSSLSEDIQNSLFKIIEGNPDLLNSVFFDTFINQTSLGAGRKMAYWQEVGVPKRLKYGEVLRNFQTSDSYISSKEANGVFTGKIERLQEVLGNLEEEIDSITQGLDIDIKTLIDDIKGVKSKFLQDFVKKSPGHAGLTSSKKAISLFDNLVNFGDIEKSYKSLINLANKAGMEVTPAFLKGDLFDSIPSALQDSYLNLTGKYIDSIEEGFQNAKSLGMTGLFKQRLHILRNYEQPLQENLQRRGRLNEQLLNGPTGKLITQLQVLIEYLQGNLRSLEPMTNVQNNGEKGPLLLPAPKSKESTRRKVNQPSLSSGIFYVDSDGNITTSLPAEIISSRGVSTGSTGSTGSMGELYNEEQYNRLREYLNLLKEQKNVEYEIYKLEQERKVLRKKQDDTGLLGNKSELKDLKKLRKSIQAEIGVFESDDDFMSRNKNRIDERKAIIADETKYKQDKWLAGFKVDTAETSERELTNLLSKRLGLEKQIVSAQHSIDISYSKQEKGAYRNIIAMTQQEVNLLDEKIAKLVKSGILRKEEADSIFRQYQIQQQSMLAQQMGKDHGSRSIWDMMKYDMSRSISRIFDYGISFRLLYSIPRIFNQINMLTQQLETSLMNLRVVTGYNREEANSLIIAYQKLGKELGATTQEVANSANEWLRQGYSAEEAGDLIEASTKLSKLGMISSSEATQYLTSALKGYKLEAESAIDVVDKLTKVDMEAAVSAGDIAEGLSRTATSAQLAGLDLDETIGILSTIGEVTQKSMQSVGESLKTLLSRYGNVKAGVFSEMGLDDDGETTENINDIEKVLGKLGISIRSSSLEMRDISVVLDELAEKWGTLDTVSKNAVATAFAGTRQRENFNVLMENYERAKELTEESAESTGTANEKYEAYTDSLEAAQKRLTNAWEELTIEIGASPLIKDLTKGAALLIENFDTLIQGVLAFGSAWASVKIPGWLSTLGSKITGGGQLSNFFFNSLGWGGEKLRGLLGVSSNSSIINTTKENNVVAAINETSSEILTKLDTLIQVTQDKKIKEPLSAKNTGPQGEFRNGQYWYYNNGKPITRDSSGKIIRVGVYGKNSKVKLTKKQEEAYLKAEKEALYQQRITQEEQQRLEKQLKRQRVGSAITSGIATGIMSGAMTQEVQGIGATKGQSVDATTADKVITGAVTGGLTAAGTALLGPMGSVIGSLLGNHLSQLFTFWNHKSELERKQRVQEAEQQLEALSKIEDALQNYSSLVANKDMWDTDDYAQAKSYVGELATVMRESVDLQERFVKAVRENVEGMEDTDLAGIFSKMILGTSEERSEIDRLAQIALLEQQRQEQIAANEEVYITVAENIDKGISIKGQSKKFEGNTLQEKLDNAQEFYDTLAMSGGDAEALADLQEGIKVLKELISTYNTAEEAVRDYDAQIGYLKSGVTDLTNDELESLTYQGVIDKVAQAMEDNGVAVRDYAGVIKDEYLTIIESIIKSDSKMSGIIKGEAKSYEELIATQEKMAAVLERLGGEYTYNDLKEIIEFASPENQELFTKLAEKLGLTEDNLRGLIYSADPTNIENLAYALHMTVEELEKLGDVVNNISFNDTLLSPEEVRSKYDDYFTFYEDLAEDGALSQENLEKIIASYPELLDKLSNMDELGSVLSSELFSDTSGKNVLYSNSLFTEYLSNTKFFDNFKEEYKTVIEGLDEDLRKTLENATNFDQIGAVLFGDLGENSEELQKALQEYFTFVLQPEIDTSQIDKVIEYQTKLLDDQIDNLEEQKEALSEINDEREKELNLIRAQQALENARKEKKRVYREGVGWTYEADDEAISEAQDKLDELDTEKKQDELQLEIDKLTLQKEILESFSEQKELEALKTVYEEWLENVNLANEEQVNILSRIGEIYNSLVTIDFSELFNKWRDSQEDKNSSSVGRISDLWDELQQAQDEVNRTTAGTFEYNTAVDTYNTKLQQINEAIKESGMTEDEIYGKITNGEDLKTALEKGELAEATLRLLMTGVAGDDKETTMYLTGVEAGAGDIHEQFKRNKYTYIKPFDPQTNSWGDFVSLEQYNNDHPNNTISSANLQDLPDYTIIGNSFLDDFYAYALDGKLYWLSAADAKKPGMKKKASGTLSLENNSPLLINELGTEGIVTPAGTITALPSKTGIIPADITKNLWELGEVAPNLIRTLDSLQPIETNNQNSTVNENGTYIDEINMSIYPTKDYDMNKFIAEMKTYARITRHNN